MWEPLIKRGKCRSTRIVCVTSLTTLSTGERWRQFDDLLFTFCETHKVDEAGCSTRNGRKLRVDPDLDRLSQILSGQRRKIATSFPKLLISLWVISVSAILWTSTACARGVTDDSRQIHGANSCPTGSKIEPTLNNDGSTRLGLCVASARVRCLEW